MTDGTDGRSTVLRGPGLVLTFDDSGAVTVAGVRSPDEPWLVGAGTLTLTTDDGPVALGAPVVEVDVDEVEVRRTGAGVRTLVRHAVAEAWDVRLVLANETDDEVRLSGVRLGWPSGPGTVVTALAAGADAAYAVQHDDGRGPLLVGRLRSGAQAGVDAVGLVLGPLVLAPRHRWAAQWRWRLEPDARGAGRTGDLPRTRWLDLEQGLALPAGPDVAVVAPDVGLEVEERRVEVTSPRPGTYEVELRSARGTTTYALTWAPDLDALVDAAAAAALAGPTTPAGTARLAGPALGLLVQDALERHAVGDADAAADALELLAGELVDALDDSVGGDLGEIEPLTLAFLAREADRAADPALRDAAAAGLLAVTTPRPGVGFAGVGIALALVRAGRPADAVGAHLATLLAAAGPETGAALELVLLLSPDAPSSLRGGLRRLGAGLGAGLPGDVSPAAAPEALAYAAALLGLVDETVGQRLREVWGISAAELMRRTAAQARARVGPSDDQTLAWLVLGRAPT